MSHDGAVDREGAEAAPFDERLQRLIGQRVATSRTWFAMYGVVACIGSSRGRG
jgi:hypothetical protein